MEGMLSKMPENIVRLAGMFHLLVMSNGNEISRETLKQVETAYFYYQQALTLSHYCSDSTEHNADVLYKWLLNYK